jgi:hypothetical protein
MAKKDGKTTITEDIDINVDELIDHASDEALREEYDRRFVDGLHDIVDDLRKAFADGDKMHFNVLLDRLSQ